MEMHFWGNNLRAIAAALPLISTACRHETGLLSPPIPINIPSFAGVGHAWVFGIAMRGGTGTREHSQRDNRRCVFRSCRLFQINEPSERHNEARASILFRVSQTSTGIQLSTRYCKLVLPTNALQFLEVGCPHARYLSARTVSIATPWR